LLFSMAVLSSTPEYSIGGYSIIMSLALCSLPPARVFFLFAYLQCSLINKNTVLSVTQIRVFPLHEPLVSRLQAIVRASCHKVEG
jgi:hypothetical protein